jgi:uncharacterized LabA/DUF88 family protein
MSLGNNSAALLIDADNLSAEGAAEALAHLTGEGLRVSLRRAYGSQETLAAVKDLLQRASFRAVVNQGKGTTDAALVVDVMDLLYANCLPGLIAIGSGDGDFAPLVVRLREAGMRVICFAQRKKAADGLDRFYDEVLYVEERPARASRPAAPTAARKTARKSPAAKSPPAPAPEPAPATGSDRVRQLLESFPGFADGQEIALNEVVKMLRDEKLMARSTSVRNFFKKHAPDVELRPETQPNKLLLPVGRKRR